MRITNATQLNEAIALMQAEEKIKKEALVDQFRSTVENLKPANMIKQVLNKVINFKDITDEVIDSSIGRGAGILSKKILVGKPSNIFKRIFGTIVELTVANAVAKNADGIKGKAFELIKKLIK